MNATEVAIALVLSIFGLMHAARFVRHFLIEPALQPSDVGVAFWSVVSVPGGFRVYAESWDGQSFQSFHTTRQAADEVLQMCREYFARLAS